MTTTPVRWDPFSELSEIRSRFDRMMEDFTSRGQPSWTPAIDIVREDGSMVIRADIPGAKPEDVRIEVENDVLTISGSHEEHTEEQHKKYTLHERRCGSFARSLSLPAGVHADDIKATSHDGVFELRIPIPTEARKETVTITPTAG